MMLNQRWVFKNAKYKNIGKICITRKNWLYSLIFTIGKAQGLGVLLGKGGGSGHAVSIYTKGS